MNTLYKSPLFAGAPFPWSNDACSATPGSSSLPKSSTPRNSPPEVSCTGCAKKCSHFSKRPFFHKSLFVRKLPIYVFAFIRSRISERVKTIRLKNEQKKLPLITLRAFLITVQKEILDK